MNKCNDTHRARERERQGGGRYMKIYATASNCGVGDGPEISTIVFPFNHFLARSFSRAVCAVVLCVRRSWVLVSRIRHYSWLLFALSNNWRTLLNLYVSAFSLGYTLFSILFAVLLRGHVDGTSSGEALETFVPVRIVSFREAATN